MARSEGVAATVSEDLSGAPNVLISAPALEAGGEAVCAELLSPPAGTPGNILFVTLTDSPDERLAAWRAHSDLEEPAEIGFLAVGDAMRSTAGQGATVESDGTTTRIETVSSAGDLTGLGVKTGKFLSAWADRGGPIRVCFHSLSTLLQYVDTKQAFKFLHVLTGRFDAVDAVSHFHIDPTAHDDRTVNTLLGLFDAVVKFEDGEWTVRKR